MARAAIFLTALLSLFSTRASAAFSCKYSEKGASYDLSALATLTASSPAVVSDRIQTSQKDYQYTFGICNTAPAPTNCKNADGTSRVKFTSAPGWQTKISESKQSSPGKDLHCFYLGNPDMSSNTQWSLLDKTDPGAGVTLTYTGGQHCSNGQQRALAINFKCAKNKVETFEKQIIDESAHCTYAISLESEYACPTECGFGSAGSMCNNHGICRYDTDAKKARCFCNNGFSGPGCDQTPEEAQGYGPLLGLLIFVTIGVVALIAGIVFLWRYMQKRTLPDQEQYGRMQSDFGGGLVENAATDARAGRIGSGAAGL